MTGEREHLRERLIVAIYEAGEKRNVSAHLADVVLDALDLWECCCVCGLSERVQRPNVTWPYPEPLPKCEDDRENDGWTCVVWDGTGLWCDTCLAWAADVEAALSGRNEQS